MTPGEIKGYARQAMARPQLTDQEKTAISLLLDGLDAMIAVSGIVLDTNKEIKDAKTNNSNTNGDTSS